MQGIGWYVCMVHSMSGTEFQSYWMLHATLRAGTKWDVFCGKGVVCGRYLLCRRGYQVGGTFEQGGPSVRYFLDCRRGYKVEGTL